MKKYQIIILPQSGKPGTVDVEGGRVEVTSCVALLVLGRDTHSNDVVLSAVAPGMWGSVIETAGK